ncbi:MAG: asparagine synthase-related protein [Acidobacteriota bacterium]
MSALGLAMARQGAELLPAILERLLGHMAHRGREGLDTAGGAGGVLGHLHFWTTPEELGEHQPIPVPGHWRAWLAFDGRIDDRETLWRALPDSPGPLRKVSDARLAAAVFAAWGIAGFERLLGPFAIAIWDATRREAILARDALGGRNLAVALDDRRLLAASEEGAVAATLGREMALDRTRVAAYFSLEDPEPGRTFYQGVRQLEPGEILIVRDDRARSERLSRPRPAAGLLKRRPEERAEELRHRLDLAVRCRLRSAGRPAVLLSGGLDSAPIAALAQRALPAGDRLRALSWVFPRHPRADESRHLSVLERALNLELHRLPCDDELPLADLASWPTHPATPEQNAYRHFHQRAYEAAQRIGSPVLLSGLCGDQLYGGAEYRLKETLRAGRFGAAAGELWRRFRAGDGALRQALGALLPDRLRLERAARRKAERFAWLTESSLALLPEPIERDGWAAEYPRPAQARSLLGAQNGHGLSIERYYCDPLGIEVRHPMRDRRVIELFLGLPAEDLGVQGNSRPILRQALSGLLPGSILDRQDKATFEDLFVSGVYADPTGEVAAILLNPNAAWRDYLLPEWVETGWRERRCGLSGLLVWLAFSFEIWQRRSPEKYFDSGVRGAFEVPQREISACRRE